jgi:hypothetical protein
VGGIEQGTPLTILIHEDQFDPFMGSVFARELEVSQSVICIAPGLFFSKLHRDGQGETLPHSQASAANQKDALSHLKYPLNRLVYLEPFEIIDKQISRYYLYGSHHHHWKTRQEVQYSHDYLFYVLNLLHEHDTPKQGKLYPYELDVFPADDFSTGMNVLLKHIREWQNQEQLTIDLSRALNLYYSGQCRFLKGSCTACSLNHMIIDGNGGIYTCLWGTAAATLSEGVGMLRERVREMSANVQRTRGCQSCPVYDGCPRCLFIGDDQTYCQFMRTHPYAYRYLVVYDFLRQLIKYDVNLSRESTVNLKISSPHHRHLLSRLAEPIPGKERGQYRVNDDLLPVIVDNTAYVYHITHRTIIKLDSISFLILEGLEENIGNPYKLVGNTFNHGGTIQLKNEHIDEAVNRLIQAQLIAAD